MTHAVLHPVLDRLASQRDGAPLTGISFGSLSGEYPATVGGLARFDSTSAVGVLQGADEFLFGSIVDGAVDADGRVLLLDPPYGLVRILSAELAPLSFAGAAGDGPGEFVRPVGIVTTEQSARFGVVDEEGMRIEWFDEDAEGVFVSAGRTQLPLYMPTSACMQGGRLLVTGIRARSGTLSPEDTAVFSETIHEVNDAGDVERSFSAPYLEASDWSDWIVAVNLLSAQIACTSEAIWVAYPGLGEVHALEPDGTVRWIVRIDDLDHPGFLQQFRADGSWAFGMNLVADDDQAIESVSDVALIDDDVLAVSVTFGRRSEPRATRHGTLFLNARDGSPLGAFVAEHRVLAGARGAAVLYRSRPFPQVAVVGTRGP